MSLHKAFIDVGEKGAEAATATAILFEPKRAKPDKYPPIPFHPEFRADHPFLFLTRDMESGAVLFIGRVNEP
jgi:serpin B